MISHERLAALLAKLPELHIALAGDLFLDRYLDIDPDFRELSVETGLEAYQITRVRNSPGALGTVLNNLAALGVGKLTPVTVVGDDGQADDLLRCLESLPVDPRFVIRSGERLTPTYTKPMKRDPHGDWRELNRLDLRNKSSLPRAAEDAVLAALDRAFDESDGLIVADQLWEESWGVVSSRVREKLSELGRRRPEKLLFVDSRARVDRFRDCTLKPNQAECRAALARLGHAADEVATWEADRLAAALRDATGGTVYCTRGERGSVVALPGQPPLEAPAFPVAGPVDTVGAGDSTTAGIVTALLAGATPLEAATVGNLVASITVQQLGTTGTASPQQVLARRGEFPHAPQ